jgi:NADH-quinone oxidoreductase subunit G
MDNGLYNSYIDKNQKEPKKPNIDFGGGVLYNPNRCVLCTRCVRFTKNITKSNELGVLKRANNSYISTLDGLDNNSYGKNIVDLCPVGALSDREFRFKQRVWFLKSTPSFCISCAKVCSIYIDHNREKNRSDKIYRFRPRENSDINGYFICDYGRDSFNYFQSNLTTNEIEPQNIINSIKDKIKKSKNIVVMVDANLYNEDIDKIYKFSKTISAKIISPLEPYYDKNFGDKWLKNSYKCANIYTIKEYNIAQELDIDDDIDLLINFNHPTPLNAKYTISFQTHNDNRVSDIKVPIKVYTQYSGTITNIDGVTQVSQKAIDSDVFSVSEWIEEILEKIFG